MKSEIIKESLGSINNYLANNYSKTELHLIYKELNILINDEVCENLRNPKIFDYDELQLYLSSLNEKGIKRKSNGVYYTPNDVVKFIYINSIKLFYKILNPNNLHVQDLNGIPYEDFCYLKSVFDPTCGASEFLMVALAVKFNLLDLHHRNVENNDIKNILKTIYGNDLDCDSTTISKLRILLYILNRYGARRISGCASILNENFSNLDFINLNDKYNTVFDVIIGNPPYVEDSKCDTKPVNKYGNVYANVLENVSKCLKEGGTMGFIVPLSYVSTPRMRKIRDIMNRNIKEQYILSYCDRPDCLFNKVHQKLCILIGKNVKNKVKLKIHTGNYQFWYKEERDSLFNNVCAVENDLLSDMFIPKLGTNLDYSIYKKVTSFKDNLYEKINFDKTNHEFHLNMRAAFWIKAFKKLNCSGDYKQYTCASEEDSFYVLCLLNSSLFWWYWICVSDCWHITNKELIGFTIPKLEDFKEVKRLEKALEKRLEKTKKYIGTKQIDYEYKHRKCIKEIHAIDDYICDLYGFSEEEKIYIKNFAYRYRVSGGVKNENN
ncbi:MAG: N-6 DNA methylase [Anaeroplasma bactoclasticum]|nr:N-6 DNA methylase [Anaeroplasma bactoclasticum]